MDDVDKLLEEADGRMATATLTLFEIEHLTRYWFEALNAIADGLQRGDFGDSHPPHWNRCASRFRAWAPLCREGLLAVMRRDNAERMAQRDADADPAHADAVGCPREEWDAHTQFVAPYFDVLRGIFDGIKGGS
jgi:hypothetical protein